MKHCWPKFASLRTNAAVNSPTSFEFRLIDTADDFCRDAFVEQLNYVDMNVHCLHVRKHMFMIELADVLSAQEEPNE